MIRAMIISYLDQRIQWPSSRHTHYHLFEAPGKEGPAHQGSLPLPDSLPTRGNSEELYDHYLRERRIEQQLKRALQPSTRINSPVHGSVLKPYLIAEGPCRAWSAWQLQAGDVLQRELAAKPPEGTKHKNLCQVCIQSYLPWTLETL